MARNQPLLSQVRAGLPLYALPGDLFIHRRSYSPENRTFRLHLLSRPQPTLFRHPTVTRDPLLTPQTLAVPPKRLDLAPH